MKNLEEAATLPVESISETEEQKRKKWTLPRLKRPRRRRVIAALVAVLVLAGIVLRLQQGDTAQAGANYQPVSVTRQDIAVTVSGSGTLAPADAYPR